MVDLKSKDSSLSESEKIWNEIRLLPINMWSLPNQKVEDHANVLKGGLPNDLILKPNSPGVVAQLDEILDKQKYTVEQIENGYLVVRRVINVEFTEKPSSRKTIK